MTTYQNKGSFSSKASLMFVVRHAKNKKPSSKFCKPAPTCQEPVLTGKVKVQCNALYSTFKLSYASLYCTILYCPTVYVIKFTLVSVLYDAELSYCVVMSGVQLDHLQQQGV